MDQTSTALGTPSLQQMNRQVAHAQAMFQRVLMNWAGDVLELRRRSLLVPQWESAPSLFVDVADSQADLPDQPMNRAA